MKLVLDNVTVDYNGYTALRNVSLTLTGPGLYQVIGPNGAGKTTMLKVILGLVKPVKGRVLVDGVEVTGSPGRAGRFIGYVPQNPGAPQLSPMTVIEFIEASLEMRGVRRPRTHAVKALNSVGVGREYYDYRLWELSGGILQRVYIARALAPNPPILVMDEPLANIDPSGRLEIAQLISRISKDKLVVTTSHDPNLLLSSTKAIIIVNREVIAVGPPREVMRREVLARVYGGSVVEGIVLAGEGGAHG